MEVGGRERGRGGKGKGLDLGKGGGGGNSKQPVGGWEEEGWIKRLLFPKPFFSPF